MSEHPPKPHKDIEEMDNSLQEQIDADFEALSQKISGKFDELNEKYGISEDSSEDINFEQGEQLEIEFKEKKPSIVKRAGDVLEKVPYVFSEISNQDMSVKDRMAADQAVEENKEWLNKKVSAIKDVKKSRGRQRRINKGWEKSEAQKDLEELERVKKEEQELETHATPHINDFLNDPEELQDKRPKSKLGGYSDIETGTTYKNPKRQEEINKKIQAEMQKRKEVWGKIDEEWERIQNKKRLEDADKISSGEEGYKSFSIDDLRKEVDDIKKGNFIPNEIPGEIDKELGPNVKEAEEENIQENVQNNIKSMGLDNSQDVEEPQGSSLEREKIGYRPEDEEEFQRFLKIKEKLQNSDVIVKLTQEEEDFFEGLPDEKFDAFGERYKEEILPQRKQLEEEKTNQEEESVGAEKGKRTKESGEDREKDDSKESSVEEASQEEGPVESETKQEQQPVKSGESKPTKKSEEGEKKPDSGEPDSEKQKSTQLEEAEKTKRQGGFGKGFKDTFKPEEVRNKFNDNVGPLINGVKRPVKWFGEKSKDFRDGVRNFKSNVGDKGFVSFVSEKGGRIVGGMARGIGKFGVWSITRAPLYAIPAYIGFKAGAWALGKIAPWYLFYRMVKAIKNNPTGNSFDVMKDMFTFGKKGKKKK